MALEFDNSLSTRHISTNLAEYESARSGFFVLEIADLDNLIKPDFSNEPDRATSNDKIKTASDILRLNVLSAPVPHFSLNTEEFRRGNDVVKFATIPTWDSGTIKVDDIVGVDTKSILMAWLYKAYNPHTRKGGRMKDYKKAATLIEYTQDYEIIRTWHLEGCFITKISEEDFDRESDGKRKMTIDFVYDRATVELPSD